MGDKMSSVISKILFILITGFILISSPLYSQQIPLNAVSLDGDAIHKRITELEDQLEVEKNDTTRSGILGQLVFFYMESKPELALEYTKQILAIAIQQNDDLAQARCYQGFTYFYDILGEYSKSLEYSTIALEKIKDPLLSYTHPAIKSAFDNVPNERIRTILHSEILRTRGSLFGSVGNRERQISDYLSALKIVENMRDTLRIWACSSNLAWAYANHNKLDSALLFSNKSFSLYNKGFKASFANPALEIAVFTQAGYVAHLQEKYGESQGYYLKGLEKLRSKNHIRYIPFAANVIALNHYHLGNIDSLIFYSRMAVNIAENFNFRPAALVDGYINVSKGFYELGEPDSAYYYQSLGITLQDSLNDVREVALTKFHNAIMDQNLALEKQEADQLAIRNKRRIYALGIGIGLLLLIGILLYRNIIHKNKSNRILADQKNTLENTLEQLKATQAQLVQSEKMASLGELTAGIAHEIQNPLNFVNNFSEVSAELVDEMNEEIEKGDLKEVKAIALDIKQNLDKIVHHGKRADGIVKGMLMHSRSSSGDKVPTDINALVYEYLRLAYHGIRAKDSEFNSEMKTNFESSIGKIDIAPQEIGRVLLNLITNAFHAVQERSLSENGTFRPLVEVSTLRNDDSLIIMVKDNGQGISEEIRNKIFQPFFTTKETGKGTGLGLSLSYDIIKTIDGEILVNSQVGEGTEFIVSLPYKSN